MLHKIFLITASLPLLYAPGYAGEIGEISGDWQTVKHGAAVKIQDCGDTTPCGYLLSAPDAVAAGEQHDIRNPDRNLRDRPLSGLPLLWGYSKAQTHWKSGRLYNPETGQTFRSSMELISPTKLKVKGCMGPFCRSQIWTRITSNTSNTELSRHD